MMTSWVWNKMTMDSDPGSITVCETLSEYLSFPKLFSLNNTNLQGLL